MQWWAQSGAERLEGGRASALLLLKRENFHGYIRNSIYILRRSLFQFSVLCWMCYRVFSVKAVLLLVISFTIRWPAKHIHFWNRMSQTGRRLLYMLLWCAGWDLHRYVEIYRITAGSFVQYIAFSCIFKSDIQMLVQCICVYVLYIVYIWTTNKQILIVILGWYVFFLR